MWTFDANNYMKSVLVPALERFKEDGHLPDLFQRYGLALDVSDEKEIQEALKTTTAFWNKTRLTNKRYESLLVALLKDAGPHNKAALRELTDVDARATRSAQATNERQKRRSERFDELKSSVGVVAVKGFITPAEKAELLSRFQAAGFTAPEIESHIRVPVREGAKKLPTEPELEQVIRNRIRNSLGVLKERDLYEFLGVGPGAQPAEIEERHTRLSAEWDRRPSNFDKTAAHELLGLVKTLFSSGLEKYEAARIYDILDKLRPEVKLAAIDKRISLEEFNYLHSLATGHGLEKTLASDFILALAEKFGASVEWAAGEETIRCASCSSDRPKREKKCTVCGADLWTNCPKCKTLTVISASACANCGFVVADVLQVRLLVRRAQLALEDGTINDALSYAREAERLWGRQDEVAAVLLLIEARRKVVDDKRRSLDEAVGSKRLQAARRVLDDLARTFPGYAGSDGKTVEQLKSEIEGRMARLDAVLRRAREHEKNYRVDDAIFAFLEAIAISEDSVDALNGLRRNPPAAPTELRTSVYEDHVLVEWKPSSGVGNLEYLVVRREGRPPAAPDDGETIGRTTALSCRDSGAKAGSLCFYSVFAARGRTTSNAAASGGLLVAREVTNFTLEASDGVVKGTWDFDLLQGRVHAFCREGQPPDRAPGRELTLAGPHNFIDNKVENGRLYYYRVSVEYKDARGHPIFTPGLVQSVRPEKPPKPVDHMVVTFDDGVLNLIWAPPPYGKVDVYRAADPPVQKSGTQIPVARIAELGTRLQSKLEAQAVDLSPPNKPAYYVPVTIAGDVAVIGTARRFVSLPDVSGTVAEDFGHYIQLRWQWPGGCQSAWVAWRPDIFPQDAQDSRAIGRRISRGEYEGQGGFRIEGPARIPYKFVVFAALESGGETLYSGGVRKGARAEVGGAQPVAVSYTLSRGLLLHRSRFTLVVSAGDAVGSLPEVVVIAKRGDLQPLRSDDGAVVASLRGVSLSPGESVPFQFELNGLQRPLYLRAFFREASSYQSFRLIDPPPAQLKVR